MFYQIFISTETSYMFRGKKHFNNLLLKGCNPNEKCTS